MVCIQDTGCREGGNNTYKTYFDVYLLISNFANLKPKEDTATGTFTCGDYSVSEPLACKSLHIILTWAGCVAYPFGGQRRPEIRISRSWTPTSFFISPVRGAAGPKSFYMRKSILFFSLALMAMLGISCSKSVIEENSHSKSNYVEVGLSLAGEIVDISYSPLVKGSPTNPADSTLYVVAAYCVDSTSSTKGTSVMSSSYLYAHGVFDDMSKAHLRLLAGKRYSIRVKAIVNGISAIYHFNDLYDGTNEARMYSHQGHLTNSFFYKGVDNVVDVTKNENYVNMDHATLYYADGSSDTPKEDIYYGGCDDILVSNCAPIIPIDMYYSHCKLIFKANGLKPTDGALQCTTISGGGQMYAPSFSLSYDKPEYSFDRCFYYLESMYSKIKQGSEYSSYFDLTVKYSTVINGQQYSTTIVNNKEFTIPRKTTTTFTFNIDHDKIVSNSTDFSLTFDSDDMSKSGGDYEYTGTIKE